MMKSLATVALAAFAATLSAPAAAQFAKKDDAVEYRQGAFTIMGHHFSRIGAMVNGKIPFDAKTAQADAEIVASVAKLPWAAFGAGTEGGKAKPALWKEEAKFKDHASKTETETAKLAAAAKTGNLDSIKAAFGDAAGSCKACHDAYRNK